MNILHTLFNDKHGGGETYLVNLIDHLNDAEFKSTVVVFSEGVLSKKLEHLGVKHYVISTKGRLDPTSWKELTRIAKAEQVDLINAHGTKAGFNSFWTSRILNIPLVYTVQNWAFQMQKSFIKRNVRIIAERLLVHQTKANITVSLASHKTGKKLLNTPNPVIIPNGVDTIKFNHCTKGNLTKSDLGIPRNRTLFGFIARLCQQKDPLTLLKGFRAALSTDHNLHLLIVGEGNLKKDCIKSIEDLKLEAHVTYLPYVEDVTEVLSILDVYCLPSKWENLPFGILEAMAMKKAVIATPVDGITEVIANDVNGLLVPCENEESWKDAILKLHNQPELRREYASRGRLIVEAHHDIHNSALKVSQVYRDVMNNRPNSGSPIQEKFA